MWDGIGIDGIGGFHGIGHSEGYLLNIKHMLCHVMGWLREVRSRFFHHLYPGGQVIRLFGHGNDSPGFHIFVLYFLLGTGG